MYECVFVCTIGSTNGAMVPVGTGHDDVMMLCMLYVCIVPGTWYHGIALHAPGTWYHLCNMDGWMEDVHLNS